MIWNEAHLQPAEPVCMPDKAPSDWRILALDTSGPSCSAAVLAGDAVLAELILNTGRTHARTAARSVRTVLSLAGCDYSDLDVIAVTDGPGSFTGIRIGLALVKGLAFALNRPVIPVDSLSALAEMHRAPGTAVASALDARGGRLYAQLTDPAGRPVLEPAAVGGVDFAAQIAAALPGLPALDRLVLVGNGAAVLQAVPAFQALAAALPSPVTTADADGRISAGAVGRLALRLAAAEPERILLAPDQVSARYLSRSQAERLSGIAVTECPAPR